MLQADSHDTTVASGVQAAPDTHSSGNTAAQTASVATFVRTDISPQELFEALERLRSEAGAEIERLIALLDTLDDPDLEPNGDELDPSGDEREPELGSIEGRKGFDQSTWAAGDDMVDGGEPSLGAPENHPRNHGYIHSTKPFRDVTGSQIDWSAGNDDGREGDAGFDDREGDELEHGGESEREDHELSGDEDEPSLGSFDRLANQDHGWRQTQGDKTWWFHNNNDREADAAL